MRILYDSKSPKHKSVFGCLAPHQRCTLNLHIPSSCGADKVSFETECKITFDLSKTASKDGYDIFSGEIFFENAGLYFYFFRINDKNGSYCLFKDGYNQTNISSGDMWQVSCISENFKTPEEFKGKVFYQVFPDRFYKSGEVNLAEKLTPYTVHESTEDMPVFAPDKNGEVLNNDFFGGNLKGIEEKLEYIKSLGCLVVYLNPICKAFSNHRYDTCDYKKVDEMLGTNEDFASLCKKAHSLGMKVILDGVFSHTGSDSIYFDAKKRFGTGVMSCPDSVYKGWYNFRPDGGYESWWGISTLPCVDELNPHYLDYMILSEDSVIKHWLSLGCDGFRLDVADELPGEFIYLLRKRVKEINPHAIVIGEVWEDASNKISYGNRRKYFTGEQLDTVMNYPFRNAIIDLCCGRIGTDTFKYKIMTICENYPEEAVHCLMNSLSTHDTERIMTVLSGAPLDMSRETCAKYTLKDDEISRANARIKLAVALQFFLPGSACIYYGDEIGMLGFRDPFNRAYFNWNKQECEIRDFTKAMAKIKNESGALKKGDISFLPYGEGILAMERKHGKNRLTLVANLSQTSFRLDFANPAISYNCTVTKENMYVSPLGFAVF